MVPVLLFCVLGGCLDQPIDTRTPERRIRDVFSEAPITSCYGRDGEYYKDCRDYDPYGFKELEE